MTRDPGAGRRLTVVLTLVVAVLCVLAPAAVGDAKARPTIEGRMKAPRVTTRAVTRATPPPRVVARPSVGPAAAGASIVVTYTGFTPAAQAAFQRAVDLWAAAIDSSQVIHIDASWATLGSNVLGSAGPSALYQL